MKRNLIAAFLFACVGLATTHGSGGPYSGKPAEIPNLFDPELADLKSTNNQALADFTKGALDATKSGNKEMDRDCYPKPITITVSTKPIPNDPNLEALLAQTRVDALNAWFSAHGIDPQNVEQVKATGPEDGRVDGMYSDEVDRDPPILKTNSTPPKGTKVKQGDQIKIHATAADSHKSWPSGVKSLQLSANGTLVDSKDYGMKPPPCEVRVYEPVYTVPRNPPLIVHLRIYTEDATGHNTFEEADFPTSDWYGYLDWSAHNTVATGTQDWSGHADLALDEDGKGGLTGRLAGTESQTLAIAACQGVTSWTVNARLTGTITTSAQKITINAADRKSTRPKEASCGRAITGWDIFMYPPFDGLLRSLSTVGDGSYSSQREFSIASGSAKLKLTLRHRR